MEKIKEKVEEEIFLSAAEEMKLVRSSYNSSEAVELLVQYVKRFQLNKKSEVALMKGGNVVLIVFYLKNYSHCIRKQSAIELITRHKWQLKAYKKDAVKLMNAYLEGYPSLWIEVEMALIKSGSRAMIATFIRCREFDSKVQVELIKSPNEDLIKYHIIRHGLEEKAQMELVRQGNKELLLFYLEHEKLCDRAWQYWQVLNS